MWARVAVIDRDGRPLAWWEIGGRHAPDLAAVDALARWQLWARRTHRGIELDALGDEFRDLLEWCGLLGQVGGQPEEREQMGVEEGVRRGDPVS